jgi:uncharacterized iron-regulated protein
MGNGEKSLYTFRAMITIGHSRAGGNPDSMVLDGGVMRMKKLFITILSVAVIFGLLDTIQAHLDHRLYDLQQNKEMLMSDAIVGQLNVIQSLKEAGVRVAIGLEMFRNDSQQALDQWVAGNISKEVFQAIYYNNWTYPWSAYQMIFEYARKEKIPMIGLNVPREITRQVSREGFSSLSDEQRGKLADVSCRVDKEYMDYIKKSFGGHAHGNLNFTYFCEAQLVWDSAMAVHTLEYLKKNPDAVVVLLAGAGHVQKGAVPRQISIRSDIPHAVVLPKIKGLIDRQTVSKKDADYIMIDF